MEERHRQGRHERPLVSREVSGCHGSRSMMVGGGDGVSAADLLEVVDRAHGASSDGSIERIIIRDDGTDLDFTIVAALFAAGRPSIETVFVGRPIGEEAHA